MAMASGNADVPPGVDLQQLIKERKAAAQQKAKNKQLQDFKRIALLNWKNSDGCHPLQILPKEMWRLILLNLTDPRDLHNASHCCPLFAELLEPRRLSDILFPMAFEVDRFRKELKVDRQKRKLASLRRVCKSLRHQVDKWLETSNFLKYLDYPNKDGSALKAILASFDPNCATRASKLSVTTWEWVLSIHGDAPANVDDDDVEAPAEHFANYCKLLKEALKLVGEQVQKFAFNALELVEFVEEGVTICDLYELLHELITLMPNLKSLKLFYNVSDYDEELEPEPRFEEMIHLKPFPTLGNLVNFDFRLSQMPHETAMYMSVLRSNPHITELFLTYRNNGITGDLLEAVKSLPLETLTLFVEFEEEMRDLDIPQKFVSPRPNWHLKKIALFLSTGFLNVVQLFEFLEEFQELETLHLELVDVLLTNVEGLRPLRLPNLKVFKFLCHENRIRVKAASQFEGSMIYNSFTMSLDHLLLAKELEDVNWEHHVFNGEGERPSVPWEEPTEMIRFNGGSADIYNSNVWQIFPTLKKIEVTERDLNWVPKKAVYHRQKIPGDEA